MKANVIGNCVLVVAVCVGIAAPLAAWRNAQAAAQKKDELLRTQEVAITELSAANANRKKEIRKTTANALTDEQLKELLRLRAQASALRRETNNLDRLEAKAKLTPEEQAERAQELSAELLDAARRIVAELPEAERHFREKQGAGPELNFSELRSYFPTVNGKRMPGLYTFGFIRDGGPKPGDNLLLVERGTHKTADGKVALTFAFTNGRAEEVVAPDSDDVDKYFRTWVRENWGTAGDPPADR